MCTPWDEWAQLGGLWWKLLWEALFLPAHQRQAPSSEPDPLPWTPKTVICLVSSLFVLGAWPLLLNLATDGDFDLQTESICSHIGTTHLAWSVALPGNSCCLYHILQSPWRLHCCSSGRKMGVVLIKQASSAVPSTIGSFLSLLLSHMLPKRSCVFLTVYSSTNLSVYYNACLIYLWCQLY